MNDPRKKRNLAIGLGVGGGVLLIVIIIGLVFALGRDGSSACGSCDCSASISCDDPCYLNGCCSCGTDCSACICSPSMDCDDPCYQKKCCVKCSSDGSNGSDGSDCSTPKCGGVCLDPYPDSSCCGDSSYTIGEQWCCDGAWCTPKFVFTYGGDEGDTQGQLSWKDTTGKFYFLGMDNITVQPWPSTVDWNGTGFETGWNISNTGGYGASIEGNPLESGALSICAGGPNVAQVCDGAQECNPDVTGTNPGDCGSRFDCATYDQATTGCSDGGKADCAGLTLDDLTLNGLSSCSEFNGCNIVYPYGCVKNICSERDPTPGYQIDYTKSQGYINSANSDFAAANPGVTLPMTYSNGDIGTTVTYMPVGTWYSHNCESGGIQKSMLWNDEDFQYIDNSQ